MKFAARDPRPNPAKITPVTYPLFLGKFCMLRYTGNIASNPAIKPNIIAYKKTNNSNYCM